MGIQWGDIAMMPHDALRSIEVFMRWVLPLKLVLDVGSPGRHLSVWAQIETILLFQSKSTFFPPSKTAIRVSCQDVGINTKGTIWKGRVMDM